MASGSDLTAMDLNLSTKDSLNPNDGGARGEGPVRAEDIKYPVPQEYMISEKLKDKLAPMNFTQFEDELLFHLFYNYTGDILQMFAASELYDRNWRYHIEKQIWIAKAPGILVEKGVKLERATYHVFDPTSWKKVDKEMYLDYDKLEGPPPIPPHIRQAYMTQ